MFCLALAVTLFLSPMDPELNEESDTVCPCHIKDKETQELIDTMFEVAFGKTNGLAAPQIGVQKRVIVVDVATTPPPNLQAFINPEILWQSEETAVWREECFSTGSICALVPRSKKVLIKAYDRQGNVFTQEYEGHVARIFQHEIDHLDGIRFPDRVVDDAALHWVEESEMPQYRIEWANWMKKATREQWLNMKGG